MLQLILLGGPGILFCPCEDSRACLDFSTDSVFLDFPREARISDLHALALEEMGEVLIQLSGFWTNSMHFARYARQPREKRP